MTINEQVLFLEKYKINSNELLFVSIILLIQDGDNSNYINEYFNLPTECRGGIRELLISLQDKGVITKEYKIPDKGQRFVPEDITFNKNFIKNFYRSSFDMGKELFETYPMFGIINGSTTGLRSVSKKFDTLEDFYRYYGKTIKWNPETHEYIIGLINWAKENTNYICCTLANFVIDHKWLELEALQKGDIGNVNTDAIKLV
jgi:hypothetical protein|nr:MAG TPA: putative replisome organizer protein [Bacteriophage sp.]